jgi:hypothetical protein
MAKEKIHKNTVGVNDHGINIREAHSLYMSASNMGELDQLYLSSVTSQHSRNSS